MNSEVMKTSLTLIMKIQILLFWGGITSEKIKQ